MEIGNKILELRKNHNLSQEALAEKLNVARQTISKWELNETSPDLKQAKELAKIFNISLDELVGNKRINNNTSNAEKLASIILTTSKIVGILFIILLVILIVKKIFSKPNNQKYGRIINESIRCNLYGEEHGYTISYYEYTASPVEAGSDGYFESILDLTKYNDAHQIFNIINDYVKRNNGNCIMINDHDLNDVIDISIKEGSLTRNSATIVIKDINKYKIIYGEPFRIDKYQNSTWKEVNKTGENYGFNDIAYGINEEGIVEIKQDWSHIYGNLDKGIYRLVKEVVFESDIPVDNEELYNYYIWVEFEIE